VGGGADSLIEVEEYEMYGYRGGGDSRSNDV